MSKWNEFLAEDLANSVDAPQEFFVQVGQSPICNLVLQDLCLVIICVVLRWFIAFHYQNISKTLSRFKCSNSPWLLVHPYINFS